MASYAIGLFDFVRWEGQPPPLVKQHVATFNKIGQAGIAAQNTGITGDIFEVTLSAVFADRATAMAAEETYRDLIGADPVLLKYEDIDYLFTYWHRFLVMGCDTVSMKRHPLLFGPGYHFPGGWLVKTRWRMVPIATA